MTVEILSIEYDPAPRPTLINLPGLALEADTTEAAASLMVDTAWQMVEAFTKRHYRPLVGGKVIVRTIGATMFKLPLWPLPSALTVHVHSHGGWGTEKAAYIPEIGEVELEGWTTYRLTFGGVSQPTIKPNVIQAVRNLALYLLINDPARREFRTQAAGDSSFTRETMMGALYGSGAGAMLAGEVLQ